MKLKTLFVVLSVLVLASAIPYRDQIALLNSLEVGRNEEPITWACTGCDENTKPIHSYIIEEPAQDVKAILSIYEEYTVLAFRYTATIRNVFQDLLWAIQVDFISIYRFKMNTLVPAAKSKNSLTICGIQSETTQWTTLKELHTQRD